MAPLFDLDSPDLHQGYRNLRAAASPNEQATKSALEEMWARFEPYADANFTAEFGRDPDSRFWEMYLGCALLDAGKPLQLRVNRPQGQGNPDLCIVDGERRIWSRRSRLMLAMPVPIKFRDIAEKVQHHLIAAILDLSSADGKQMEKHYWAVLKTRTIDAVRDEWRRARSTPDTVPTDDAEEIGDTDTMQLAEYRAEIERILSSVPDERKKLAFRLHLQGVPLKPGKGTTSIGGALGVSDKTAGFWVAEMLALVKSKVGESK